MCGDHTEIVYDDLELAAAGLCKEIPRSENVQAFVGCDNGVKISLCGYSVVCSVCDLHIAGSHNALCIEV